MIRWAPVESERCPTQRLECPGRPGPVFCCPGYAAGTIGFPVDFLLLLVGGEGGQRGKHGFRPSAGHKFRQGLLRFETLKATHAESDKCLIGDLMAVDFNSAVRAVRGVRSCPELSGPCPGLTAWRAARSPAQNVSNWRQKIGTESVPKSPGA